MTRIAALFLAEGFAVADRSALGFVISLEHCVSPPAVEELLPSFVGIDGAAKRAHRPLMLCLTGVAVPTDPTSNPRGL